MPDLPPPTQPSPHSQPSMFAMAGSVAQMLGKADPEAPGSHWSDYLAQHGVYHPTMVSVDTTITDPKYAMKVGATVTRMLNDAMADLGHPNVRVASIPTRMGPGEERTLFFGAGTLDANTPPPQPFPAQQVTRNLGKMKGEIIGKSIDELAPPWMPDAVSVQGGDEMTPVYRWKAETDRQNRQLLVTKFLLDSWGIPHHTSGTEESRELIVPIEGMKKLVAGEIGTAPPLPPNG